MFYEMQLNLNKIFVLHLPTLTEEQTEVSIVHTLDMSHPRHELGAIFKPNIPWDAMGMETWPNKILALVNAEGSLSKAVSYTVNNQRS